MSEEQAPPGVDVTAPSPARMYDYMLGGTDNYEVDRKAVEELREKMPEMEDAAWANRGFLQRSVRWLAERGIRQFIEIDAIVPTRNSTHEAAQTVAPDARVLYTDGDPRTRVRAESLLAQTPGTAFITAEFRDPDGLLGHEVTRAMIDFDRPVALLLVVATSFIPDEEDPWGLVRRYLDALAPGSYLVLSAATHDRHLERTLDTIQVVYDQSTSNAYPRSRAEIERFLDGLEIVPPYRGAEPELAYVGLWGAEDPEEADSDGSRWCYCAVARKTA